MKYAVTDSFYDSIFRNKLYGIKYRSYSFYFYSDSKYFIDAIDKGWAKKWKRNGWMRNKKEKALNPDLWEEVLSLIEKHDVTLHWVKGHNGHPENEECDRMAVEQSKKFS